MLYTLKELQKEKGYSWKELYQKINIHASPVGGTPKLSMMTNELCQRKKNKKWKEKSWDGIHCDSLCTHARPISVIHTKIKNSQSHILQNSKLIVCDIKGNQLLWKCRSHFPFAGFCFLSTKTCCLPGLCIGEVIPFESLLDGGGIRLLTTKISFKYKEN